MCSFFITYIIAVTVVVLPTSTMYVRRMKVPTRTLLNSEHLLPIRTVLTRRDYIAAIAKSNLSLLNASKDKLHIQKSPPYNIRDIDTCHLFDRYRCIYVCT